MGLILGGLRRTAISLCVGLDIVLAVMSVLDAMRGRRWP